MPSAVGVLEAHQDITDRPMRSIKRSAAQCLVRRNLARHISKRLIQMVVIHEAMEILSRQKSVQVRESNYGPWDGGKIKAPRPPDWFFTSYPVRDDRTIY
jgi:hypothetical protein